MEGAPQAQGHAEARPKKKKTKIAQRVELQNQHDDVILSLWESLGGRAVEIAEAIAELRTLGGYRGDLSGQRDNAARRLFRLRAYIAELLGIEKKIAKKDAKLRDLRKRRAQLLRGPKG